MSEYLKMQEPSEQNSSLLQLLRSATIPADLPAPELYQSACVGAITLMKEKRAIDDLAEAALRASAAEFQARALLALEELALLDNAAVHKLYELAISDAFQPAREFLRKSGLNDTDPAWNCARMLVLKDKVGLKRYDPELKLLSELCLRNQGLLCERLIEAGKGVLPNWTLIMSYVSAPDAEMRKTILEEYSGFSDVEKDLLRNYLLQYQPEEKDLLADIVLECEDTQAAELCRAGHIQPREDGKLALFFFLTEQWTAYYTADVDFRLIRQAYEEDRGSLRSRLIDISRRSGNSAWLQQIDTAPTLGRRSAELKLSEWLELIDSLIEQHNHTRLWEILPTVPLFCMRRICDSLRSDGFEPEDADEKEFYEQLFALIEKCPLTLPVPLEHRYFTQNTKTIGLTTGGKNLAASFLNGEIQIWDMSDSKLPARIIHTNGASLRHICIDNDGHYLAVACGDASVMIFELASLRMIKQLRPGNDPISGLFIRSDSRRLITVDSKGHCAVWAFPNGTPIAAFEMGLKECFRCAYDAGMGRVIGIGLNGDVSLYDVDRQQKITSLNIGAGTMVSSATSRADLLSFIGVDGRYSCKNLVSGRDLCADVETAYSERIMQLLDLDMAEMAVLGTSDGNCGIMLCRDGTRLADIRQKDGKAAVSGIRYESESQRLFISAVDGSIAAYDLTLFNWMTHSFGLMDLPGFERIDDQADKHSGQSLSVFVDWLKLVVQWRRRFDIEIDFGDE